MKGGMVLCPMTSIKTKYVRRPVSTHQRRVYRRKNLKSYFAIAGALVALVMGLYVYRFGTLFSVQNIHIAGATQVDETVLRQVIYDTVASQGGFLKNNGLLIRKKIFEDRVHDTFASVGIVDIKKEFFDRTLEVELSPKEEVGIACKAGRVSSEASEEAIQSSGTPQPTSFSIIDFIISSESGACRWFDSRGTFFKEALDSSGSLILKVLYEDEEDLRGDKGVLTEAMIPKLQGFKQDMRTLLNLETSHFLVPEGYYGDILAVTPIGFSILFDPQSNMEQALKNLKGVLVTMSLTAQKSVDRFDLTIENRIYTRYRTSSVSPAKK